MFFKKRVLILFLLITAISYGKIEGIGLTGVGSTTDAQTLSGELLRLTTSDATAFKEVSLDLYGSFSQEGVFKDLVYRFSVEQGYSIAILVSGGDFKYADLTTTAVSYTLLYNLWNSSNGYYMDAGIKLKAVVDSTIEGDESLSGLEYTENFINVELAVGKSFRYWGFRIATNFFQGGEVTNLNTDEIITSSASISISPIKGSVIIWF